jgi:hypothetical protein
MKITTLRAGTIGIAGLVTTGLLALPLTSATADDTLLKRDDDTPDLVLVADDDDDDDTGLGERDGSNTNTNTNTRSSAQSNTRDHTRSGANSGRDKSRAKVKKDWTTDGPGKKRVDWSQNRTNDRSRNNTRG